MLNYYDNDKTRWDRYDFNCLLKNVITSSNLETVELLLSVCKEVTKDQFIAAIRVNNKNVTKLVKAKFNVDEDENGASFLLQIAAEHGDLETVKLLSTYPEIDINRDSPLFWAAIKGHVEIVKLLLAHPKINVNKGGESPLVIAAIKGDVRIVELLLAHPDVDVNLGEFEPPLFCAVKEGNVEIVKLLLHSNADVNLECNESLLAIAVKEGNVEIVKLFVERGAKNLDEAIRLARDKLLFNMIMPKNEQRKYAGIMEYLQQQQLKQKFKQITEAVAEYSEVHIPTTMAKLISSFAISDRFFAESPTHGGSTVEIAQGSRPRPSSA